jgi:hypothetical protein
MLWEENTARTDAVATAAMSVMLSMTSGAAAGLMSSRISFHDKKPRVVWCLVSVPQRLISFSTPWPGQAFAEKRLRCTR